MLRSEAFEKRSCSISEPISALLSAFSVAEPISALLSAWSSAFEMDLRFRVGDEVLCLMDTEEWFAGTIVALNYRERNWPPSRMAPYQVLLEDGRLIFVPQDTEMLCRKIAPAWWGSLFKGAQEPTLVQLRHAAMGKDIDEGDHKGETAISTAVKLNWLPIVVDLIRMSADVNAPNAKEQFPLHHAVHHGPGMVRALLEAKAELDVQDTDPDHDPEFTSATFGDRLEHRTPLHHACALGDAAVADVLIRAGADLNIQDSQWRTPLHLAIDEGHADVVDGLLRAKADVNLGNQKSGMKNTPLMDAAHAGDRGLMEKLMATRADINAKGKSDMSALHLAARRGDAGVVQFLVEAKADVAQRSQCGTAAELARKKPGSGPILELLGESSGDPASARKAPTSIAALDAAQRAALFVDF